MRLRTVIAVFAAVLTALPLLRAEVRLPKVFGSHMVLQQDKPIVVWGWASPVETITLKLAGQSVTAKANQAGEWKASFSPLKAGGPYTLTVQGSSTVEFSDVLVGEVWLCSGQSNMEMGIAMCQDATNEIAAANYPNIRLLMVNNRWTADPQPDFEGQWKVCTPSSVAEGGWGGFSAAAYYFGRELHKKLNVAIGLIDATWGGTRIESWTPPEGFAQVPALAADYEKVQLADPRTEVHAARMRAVLDETEKWVASARQALTARNAAPPMPAFPPELLPVHDLQQSTALFNGMIHPVCPFALRGAIWYQGESNRSEGKLYTERMKALVGGWRQIWGEGDFPFFYVQIAPFNYSGDPYVSGDFYEAQAAAQNIVNSGMVVINDIGNVKDIHPTNKQEVGRRLALLALNKTYGHKDLICSGPTFAAMQLDSERLRISFDNVAGGLKSRDGQPLRDFEIIDADEGSFVPAQAVIEGKEVVLSSPEVKKPVAMRFGWSMLAEPNLVNSEGLPAGAFRAGTVPHRDLLALKVPEAKQYRLIYDLDLGKLGKDIAYQENNCGSFSGRFDRVAYFMELQKPSGEMQYVYVSMDAFTDDLKKIGVPTFASGAHFQQAVANLNVISNVKGLRNGNELSGGFIEFWPNNYGPANSAKVPNASSQLYDFGDDPSDPADGYGSMQVNDSQGRQTIFAVNHWVAGTSADLGVGNRPTANPDWTFAANAASFSAKRLRVLVRPK